MGQRASDDYAKKGSYTGENATAEYAMKAAERFKYLLPIDMGLCLTDKAAHSPLLVHVRHASLKNLRVRSAAADAYCRWKKNNRYEPLLYEKSDGEEEDSDGEQRQRNR